MAGNGHILNPFDFALAFTSPSVILPGDTLYLRAGIYTGDIVTTLKGQAGNLLTIKPYQDETVIIDGGLSGGEYLHFEHLILTDSAFTDRSAANSNDGISVGEGCEYFWCTIKNHNQGFTGGAEKDNYRIHGCLAYYNGWNSQLGHGLYTQHSSSSGYAIYTQNRVYHNFGFGFHLWAASHHNRNITLRGNLGFLNGDIRGTTQRDILVGTQHGVTNILLENNRTHSTGESAMLGWGTGNYWENVTARENKFVGLTALNMAEPVLAETELTDNEFYGALGFTEGDYPNNTYAAREALPDGVTLAVDEEDPNRAYLTVDNATALADTVQVNVSALFGSSGTVTAANVQDPLVDVQTLTITAGVISVNMQAANRSVETPVGWAAPAKTYPSFGSFILELL